jgi:hypothetical protein
MNIAAKPTPMIVKYKFFRRFISSLGLILSFFVQVERSDQAGTLGSSRPLQPVVRQISYDLKFSPVYQSRETATYGLSIHLHQV